MLTWYRYILGGRRVAGQIDVLQIGTNTFRGRGGTSATDTTQAPDAESPLDIVENRANAHSSNSHRSGYTCSGINRTRQNVQHWERISVLGTIETVKANDGAKNPLVRAEIMSIFRLMQTEECRNAYQSSK